MIKDHVSNAAAYAGLGPGIAQAMEYIRKTDFSKLSPGKHPIDDGNIFAVVQRYRPKTLDKAVWESHRKFIDVQFVVEGTERMGFASMSVKPAVKTPYNDQTDLVFYEPQGDLLAFRAGDFAIFTPQDVHAPGLAPETGAGEVFKVVVKVKINEQSGPCGM
jgi:biofilm protein TabA